MIVKVSLRSKATLDDSFCPSYKLVYNAEWLAALGIPALLAIIMLTSQSASANMIGGFDCFGESRCVSGWNHALNDAQNDYNGGQYVHQQNGGDPSCPEGHTQPYCNGYTNGYTYEWNTLYQSQTPGPIPNPQQPTVGCGPGTDNSTCSTPSQGTGPNYSGICETLQPVLIPQCNTLVDSDGSLTPDGTHAMHCIRNGILLGAGASLLGLPLPLVLKGLSILAPPTGCDGIVDMNGFNLLGNIGSISSLLNLLP